MYLVGWPKLGSEVAGDGSDLQGKEGQRPVLSEGDGELHTRGVYSVQTHTTPASTYH